MAQITTEWSRIKEVYCGNDGYHDVYWRMYARISAQSVGSTTVAVEGRLYLTGIGSFTSLTTTTSGGVVGNYTNWGVDVGGTYSAGTEHTLWSGSDTTSGTSMYAGTRFYASPWGWTGDNLYLSDTLTFTPASTAPSGLSVELLEVRATSATFNVSVGSYGEPSSTAGRYIEAGICAYNSYEAPYRYQIATNTKSATITVNNSARTGSPSLTIQPNTYYRYGGCANNTVTSVRSIFGGFATLPEAPSVGIHGINGTSVTIKYSGDADGGYHTKRLYYSIDGGMTWNIFDTLLRGDAYSNTFTVRDLSLDTDYTILTKVVTLAGTVYAQPIKITRGASPKLYVSRGGEAKRVSNFYASDNGEAKDVAKIYASVNGEAKLIHQSFRHL